MIKLTTTIDKALYEHFYEIQKLINEYKELLDSSKQFDYFKLKRFLLTAYNNLKEMDDRFASKKLVVYKQQLEYFTTLYYSFLKATDYPKTAYQKIFLSRQIEYQNVFVKIEKNKKEISHLETRSKQLEKEIKKLEERLSKMSRKNPTFEDQNNALKKLKRDLVDSIHKLASLKEENTILVKEADDFYNKYYPQFVLKLDSFKEEMSKKLLILINHLAYLFDKEIWQSAKKSSIIKNFFENSGIKDEYNSLTYLKFYLKSLNKNKLSKSQKELMEIYKILNKIYKKG